VHPRRQQLYQLVQADPKGAAEYIFKLENDVQQMNPQYLIKSIQDLDELVHTVARFSEYESTPHIERAACSRRVWEVITAANDPDVKRQCREVNNTIIVENFAFIYFIYTTRKLLRSKLL